MCESMKRRKLWSNCYHKSDNIQMWRSKYMWVHSPIKETLLSSVHCSKRSQSEITQSKLKLFWNSRRNFDPSRYQTSQELILSFRTQKIASIWCWRRRFLPDQFLKIFTNFFFKLMRSTFGTPTKSVRFGANLVFFFEVTIFSVLMAKFLLEKQFTTKHEQSSIRC